jgi:hypothetical protein
MKRFLNGNRAIVRLMCGRDSADRGIRRHRNDMPVAGESQQSGRIGEFPLGKAG